MRDEEQPQATLDSPPVSRKTSPMIDTKRETMKKEIIALEDLGLTEKCDASDEDDDYTLSPSEPTPLLRSRTPVWAPTHSFSYPVADIPGASVAGFCNTLTFQDFTEIKHMCDGSNANIFTARFSGPGSARLRLNRASSSHVAGQHSGSGDTTSEGGSGNGSSERGSGKGGGSGCLGSGKRDGVLEGTVGGPKVVIKMIKESVQALPIAIHEFDLEYGMLLRMHHTNMIKIIGAGNEPRRFMVLELLGGGTLHALLQSHEIKPGLAGILFHKPAFAYMQLLERARDLAEALDYMHFRCHEGATVIHRDLKPDNIGFTSDGHLKLFDFGLVTCVKTREISSEAYHMTGYTGSLRYMAPEVALCLPYTEKVDVYSYGIILWQMASNRLPFVGLSKAAFMEQVVRGGIRPKLDKSWSPGFTNMLTGCWQRDPEIRPSFAMLALDLNRLIGQVEGKGAKWRDNKANSSWF
mmetsp:Transcript_30955/g.68367  ORF Transcript_30955/g.68367 Transcript_30955/m.68367 type:complete len:466 (-) Transcript_30955:823-2220(-)